jgi:hypothetical protein
LDVQVNRSKEQIRDEQIGGEDVELTGMRERLFFDLFGDALFFAEQAEVVGRERFHECARNARVSILSSITALECAANSALERIRHGQRFRDDVDKLPFLSKFELFLGLSRLGAVLDRGRDEVQEVSELKKLRDFLVHPKRRDAPLRDLGGGVLEQVWPVLPHLKISTWPKSWTDADAITALGAITRFLNYFFLDRCAFSHHEVVNLLDRQFLTEPPLNQQTVPPVTVGDSTYRHAIDEWHLDLSFLGVQ